MSLRLYDTATRDVRDFHPITPGEVGIYLCGATVQSAPHIGHIRAGVAFDILVRWLRRSGFTVTLIRNVTDIDDKILAKSAAAGVPWWAWAAIYERAFTAAYDVLNVLPPTYEPRATGHVPEMTALMQLLVDRGHAYVSGPGQVWFDVPSYADYGSLTNQRDARRLGGSEAVGTGAGDGGAAGRRDQAADCAPATDGEIEAGQFASVDPADDADGKRDPRDFALWKAPKPGEPETASWETPFGRGRPGWHLECSAMARRYLGDEFDIHGGGLDLRFPHHENEQAQSRAAGFGFARHWMHSAWVTQGGAKMSKSLGNGLGVTEVLATTKPVVLRYALGAVQYRSMLEWTDESAAEAEATWDRLAGFVTRATERVGDVGAVGEVPLPEAFVAALNDDLNVPAALAVVHEHVRAGNTALAGGDDALTREQVTAVRAMLDVLGLDPQDPAWVTAGDSRYASALDSLVSAELSARAQARADRDFATADAIRDRLEAAGVVVEDSPDGARWTLADH